LENRSPDRAITESEIEILNWLFDHAPVGDVAPYRERLEQLRVYEPTKCRCGGTCLSFVHDEGKGLTMLADAVAVYSDGQMADLLLWGREGQVIWLEINEWGQDSSRRFPTIADLVAGAG
jgi:hypothetical protein